MLKKRIIPCLDIRDGRTVKGVSFVNLRDAGDPVELAGAYADQAADEIVFLDITATHEKRKTLAPLVEKIANAINIPFTVGGGISTREDVSVLISSGADKVSVNTAAVLEPRLITRLAESYGSQCIVVAIDAQRIDGEWWVCINGGRTVTTIRALQWAEEVEQRGAGEILLTSVNSDGTKEGFSTDITSAISDRVNIPVIASGGAGTMEHFKQVFEETSCSAALAASVFHFGEILIPDLKRFLQKNNINVRL
ncbi:MAG: imidazole glycerol phosphate synthase subunit HisF [Bacteroidales bacterium]|nr:imidazole glycerol phosphate synthase subunit HisF [Bacteroidales bacterium]